MKTEVLNWDGAGPDGTNGTVYSATVNTLNVRDQVTQVRQWAGPAGSGAYQDTTMTYDGYGRLKTQHRPEQQVDPNNAASTDHTKWDYNADDTIQKITDARGASQTFTYNNRHLLTAKVYQKPSGSTIPDAPSASFTYDAAGNRTTMTDGLGSVNYSYNQLSQMTSETRNFAGVGSYSLNYTYNLIGALKQITDPTNAIVHYAHDAVGRAVNVSGTNYGVSSLASGIQYRAWGAVKQTQFGNGQMLSQTFTSRLQVAHSAIPGGIGKNYQYSPDGSLKYSQDLQDARFDRAYTYDHANRLIRAFSGAEARGEASTSNRPYNQTFIYDHFNHHSGRLTKHWSHTQHYTSADNYTNNRRVGWQYDAEGNLMNNLARQYSYDAAGRMNFVTGAELTQFFDGDGQRVKTTEGSATTLYLRSSVLGGQVVADLDGAGNKLRGFIYLNGRLLAEQWPGVAVSYVHEDPSGATVRRINAQYGNVIEAHELDPAGADAELEDPYPANPGYSGRGEGGALSGLYGNITDPSRGCTLDGVYALCEWGLRGIESGATSFGSLALVRVRYSSGKTKTFMGRANLPEGIDVTFTGDYARAAWLGFVFGQNVDGGSFDNGLAWAFFNVRHLQENAGRDGVRGFISFFQPAQDRFRRVDFINLIFSRITIEHFRSSEEQQIRSELRGLLTLKCSEAFHAAQLNSPTQVVVEQGLIIRPSKDLFIYTAQQLGLVSDRTRRAYAAEFSSLRAQEGTISPVLHGTQITTDGRVQIYLHARAFEGESLLDSRFSLEDVLSHAFIHAGGQGPLRNTFDETFGTGLRHDLSGFKPHNSILASCR